VSKLRLIVLLLAGSLFVSFGRSYISKVKMPSGLLCGGKRVLGKL